MSPSHDSMPSEPWVTGIVTTFNRVSYLGAALDSLLGQTRPLDELIVVDDASQDDTPALLAGYGDRIRVIRNPLNRGKPASLNAVIPEARGDYVWLFDDDDIALPDALARHLNMLAVYPDIDFTYSGSFHLPPGVSADDTDRWQPMPVASVAPEAFLMHTMLAMYTLMQGMLLPRRALIDIGLFDAELDRCEDLDMLLRLGARYRGRGLAEPTYLYREHDGIRGAMGKQHAGTDRVAVMMDYRRRIFQRLRGVLDLPLYLAHLAPSAPAAGPDDLPDWRRPAALLWRACVMFRQGLVEEGLGDLDGALAYVAVVDVPASIRDGALQRVLDPEPWVFDRPRALAQRLVALLQRRGHPEWAHVLARGAYWAMRRAIGRRAWVEAGRAGLLVAGLEQARATRYLPRLGRARR